MGKKKRLRDNISAYMLISPALVLFSIFTIYPFLNAIFISFHQWDGFNDLIYIGLENYRKLASDKNIPVYIFQNIQFGAVAITLKMVLGFFFAVLLNNKFRGVAFFRTVYFAPIVLSYTAVSMMWKQMYNPTNGIINSLLSQIGLINAFDPPLWIADPRIAIYCLAVIDAWRWMGFHLVIYLAGLQMIPNDMYEAATIDGASKFQQLKYVTIPQIRNIALVNLAFCLTGMFNIFDLVFLTTSGGPINSTHVLVTYMYNTAFASTNQFGYATSISILLFVIILIITLLLLRLMRYVREQS